MSNYELSVGDDFYSFSIAPHNEPRLGMWWAVKGEQLAALPFAVADGREAIGNVPMNALIAELSALLGSIAEPPDPRRNLLASLAMIQHFRYTGNGRGTLLF